MKSERRQYDSESVIAIWGTGYIGFSTMLHVAEAGATCVGYDPDASRVALINGGAHPVPGLEGWLPIDQLPLLQSGQIRATSDVADVLRPEVSVHVVAVPTERQGSPWWDPLRLVFKQLSEYLAINRAAGARPPLVLVESTLAPGTTDSIILPTLQSHGLQIGKDLLLGIAPRRDWFISPDKSLRTLDRVYCGFDDRSAVAVNDFLSVLCDKLHAAPDYRVCEMVKCVENAYRHVEITLANQLTLAYPHVDIGAVLRLASTKWNMGSFRPSFGTGGYCIPLAGQYVLEGATHPESLTILSEAFTSDLEMRQRVAQTVWSRGCRSVGILGLSYRGNMKVSVMSPAILIAKHLVQSGLQVEMHDPYFSAEEIDQILGIKTFELPEDLDRFDCVLVNTDHARYIDPDVQRAILSRADKLLVIDNYGIWSQWPWPSDSSYHESGSSGWLARNVSFSGEMHRVTEASLDQHGVALEATAFNRPDPALNSSALS